MTSRGMVRERNVAIIKRCPSWTASLKGSCVWEVAGLGGSCTRKVSALKGSSPGQVSCLKGRCLCFLSFRGWPKSLNNFPIACIFVVVGGGSLGKSKCRRSEEKRSLSWSEKQWEMGKEERKRRREMLVSEAFIYNYWSLFWGCECFFEVFVSRLFVVLHISKNLKLGSWVLYPYTG